MICDIHLLQLPKRVVPRSMYGYIWRNTNSAKEGEEEEEEGDDDALSRQVIIIIFLLSHLSFFFGGFMRREIRRELIWIIGSR